MTSSHESALRVLLRFIGTSSLLALIFVPVPYSWMNGIHQYLGMGELSHQPVVGYLARSTSAFYAILGGLFLLISFDLPRYGTSTEYETFFQALRADEARLAVVCSRPTDASAPRRYVSLRD